MQAGFAFVEAGFTRAKNVVNRTGETGETGETGDVAL